MAKDRKNYINTSSISSIKYHSTGRSSKSLKGANSRNMISREAAKDFKRRAVLHNSPGNLSTQANRSQVKRINSTTSSLELAVLWQEINGNYETPYPEIVDNGDTIPMTTRSRYGHIVQSTVPWLNALQWIQRGNRNGYEYNWEITPIPCLWPPIDSKSGEILDVNGDGYPDWSEDDGNCIHYLTDLDGDGLITVNDLSKILCQEENILCGNVPDCESNTDCGQYCGFHPTCDTLWCGGCGSSYECIDNYCEFTCNPADPGMCGGVGDLNCDGIVNVVDIVGIVQLVLGNMDGTICQIMAGDCNGDGILNIQDIICVINIVLSDNRNESNLNSNERMQLSEIRRMINRHLQRCEDVLSPSCQTEGATMVLNYIDNGIIPPFVNSEIIT